MKKPGKLTIRDIAEAAGVSPATVSLVLNGKGEISGVTRARVLEAVASLNYVPRATRSSAEPGETLRFLKIAKHGHTVNRDHSVFISDYIDGMSAEATRRNYTLEVVSFEGQPISTVAESLAGAPISGVIALGTELTEVDIRLIQGLGLPIPQAAEIAAGYLEVVEQSEDYHEGPRAFVEKRKPVWKGR